MVDVSVSTCRGSLTALQVGNVKGCVASNVVFFLFCFFMTYIICISSSIDILLHREISFRHNRIVRAVVAKLQSGGDYGEV